MVAFPAVKIIVNLLPPTRQHKHPERLNLEKV